MDMGVGKTSTSILCYDNKTKAEGHHLRTLVLSPKSTLENWKREFQKFLSIGDRVLVLSGSTDKRIEQIKSTKCNIVVTNHESMSLPRLVTLFSKMPIDMLIVDEVHRFKNPNGVRAKNLIKLSDNIKYKLVLTGTLVLNGYEDLYNPLRILNKDYVGENFFAWRKRHFYNMNADKPWLNFPRYAAKPDAIKYFELLIKTAGVRVEKKDVLDLPPLVRTTHYVDLNERTFRHYKEMEKGFVTLFQGEDKMDAVQADLVVTKMLRLNQIANGILKGEDGEILVDTDKEEALLELLDDLCPAHKVVVWANFNKAIEAVERVCRGLNLYTCKVVGGQKAKERQEQIDLFNNEAKYSVMIANQAAGGVGIGLQAASYMVYYSKDYNLEKDLQSEARAYRGGSERHESITRIDLVTRGTVEEDITEALAKKMTLQQMVMGMKDKYTKK